jgi:N-acetylneuraminate synthase
MTKIQLIAEIGSIHDGSFGNAVKAIEAAAAAGVDVVKFQTHIAEAETLHDAPMPPYFKGEPRLQYFRRTAFTLAQWRELAAAARANSVGFMSSPFALEAVDLLEACGLETYKIASGEVTNLPLLERIAATGKPALLSSGMSSWAELDAAVAVLRKGGPLTILQCTTAYPCPPEEVGLNVIAQMRDRYDLPVGFSDHTASNTAAIAAATMGAVAIEKHFTFSRLMYGSDAKNAAEPAQFAALAAALREVAGMLDSCIDKDRTAAGFADMKRIFEKSIVSARPIKAGTALAVADIAFKKPGDGISAALHREILGRVAMRDIPADRKITPEDLK